MNLTGHPDVGVDHDCDGIAEAVEACRFSTIIAAWAIGGNVSNTVEAIASKLATVIINLYTCSYIATFSTQDFRFPEGVALPIGGEDRIHTHVLIEMHYDNPEELSG